MKAFVLPAIRCNIYILSLVLLCPIHFTWLESFDFLLSSIPTKGLELHIAISMVLLKQSTRIFYDFFSVFDKKHSCTRWTNFKIFLLLVEEFRFLSVTKFVRNLQFPSNLNDSESFFHSINVWCLLFRPAAFLGLFSLHSLFSSTTSQEIT